MLMAGTNITSGNDKLIKVTPEYLYHAVKNPKDAIKQQVIRLRNVLNVNPESYSFLKRKLPYVVCGHFSPEFRRTDNFTWIDHFIIDIDHVFEKGINLNTLANMLVNDERVKLSFKSPGNDGLKLLFMLSEKCYDPMKYTLFYKVFAHKFSTQYGLNQVVDKKTCDVTRACFISYDPDAYYNHSAVPVIMDSFINFENPEEITQTELLFKTQKEVTKVDEGTKEDFNEDDLAEIKKLLEIKVRTKAKKEIFVPAELEPALKEVELELKKYGIILQSVESIHYGKQLTVSKGQLWAQLNIFYGKKGFTVVKTTKRGSNSQLAEIATKIACGFLISQDESF